MGHSLKGSAVSMRIAFATSFLVASVCMHAQAPPYIYDHKVLVDESCRITLLPIENPDKPKTKKNSALCQMVKDKDTAVRQAMMFHGIPRTVNVNIREKTFLLQNPSEETVRFLFTYRLRQGHHIDLNGGPKPSHLSESEADYVVEVKPGQGIRLDIAERDH